MKVALIVMSILGCDDSGTQCTPIATASQRWTSIVACDAASERELEKFTAEKYPMIVAVCQSANADTIAEAGDEALSDDAEQPDNPAETEAETGIARRAIKLVTNALPSTQGLKNVVEKPLHIVSDTYSWVVRKISD